MTGFSDAQLGRLIAKKKKYGKIMAHTTGRHKFTKIYVPENGARLINTDKAHDRLSGPATKKIFQRAYEIFGDKRFLRLKNISTAHIYNLRGTRQYISWAKFFTKTKPTTVNIGERRKPDPDGKPGYLRVDTVHQGDLDKEKGVYYINQIAAKLLNKLLIEQTKSRARHCNDNALVEGKNGSIIRKHMGYWHIPQKHAATINKFYKDHMNIYLNYHRPCGFATEKISDKGKIKKVYDTYLTPFEALKTRLSAEKFLKDGITMESLEKIAKEKSDNECAALMQKVKAELFTSFRLKPQFPAVRAELISGSSLD